ncbi:DUF1549 and DUF1553 domain-containing protein [Planctomicrobium piriforme]|uniref:Ig-like domain (Group 2) n=1 Tax=Planctomicrobium piriforme TaxID=1576369 RepID=A0A1I3SUY7_9PLAN|nr:DUF1549 and DUF1553 domain-containing protein [Planctomicrobium piriforme]SFJ61381.1 Protein of unknown function [Planctomicrobium piriforme]
MISKHAIHIWTATLALLFIAQLAVAADVIPPASQRFANAATAESPDFQKHLVPLLGKVGCNGRACHGSFQGQGGFRLSLFGYDFDMDHKNLLERVDLDAPADSYALHKATLVEQHKGGKILEPGSWEYNIFLKWIAGGGNGVDEAIKLSRLEVTPAEINFNTVGQKQQLQAIAVWEDGTRENVTCLCRFKSNDDTICKIDAEGLVTSGEPGDSHVIVFYDNAVESVPVLRPIGPTIANRQPERTRIDQLVGDKLQKLGIAASPVCNDADFLRRVCIDITGTLPTADEVRTFLEDKTADKRARKVEELLATPAYTAWWTTRLCDWTGNSDDQLNNINPTAPKQGSKDWYDWISLRVQQNVPYDQLCEQIVLATGRRTGESYLEYCDRLSNYSRNVSGTYADEPGLMYFWGRRNFVQNEDRAIGFAYTFMGTRIQCAQCHKHPFDVWTQQDFQEFERFFDNVKFARNGANKKEYEQIVTSLGLSDTKGNDLRKELDKSAEKGKTIPFPEITVTQPKTNKRKSSGVVAPNFNVAKLLGEDEVNLNELKDPRTELMNWLRNSPTKLFAKSFVNRVWSNYFNRGIVEPTDDLSLANPPSNGPLLEDLADRFIASGYDMKWLHREICLSDAYQRDWRPTETNRLDERNFSRAVPRRLPAEVAYDVLTMATASDSIAASFRSNVKGHATASFSPPRGPLKGIDYPLAVFGRSTRESNCDCDRSMEASLLQTVFVRNDSETLARLDSRDGWLNQIADKSQELPKIEPAKSSNTDQAERIQKLQAAMKKAKKNQDAATQAKLKAQLEKARQPEPQPVRSKEPKSAQVDLSTAEVTGLIEEAYLRTLSRYPTDQERQTSLQYLAAAPNELDGLKDILWALINTKEFIVNH